MVQPALPPWLLALDEEDLHFVRRLVLASGSLKALASAYGVSYPTVRNRLDRLIARIEAADHYADEDPFQRTVRQMVAGGQMNADTARRLLRAHRETLEAQETTS